MYNRQAYGTIKAAILHERTNLVVPKANHWQVLALKGFFFDLLSCRRGRAGTESLWALSRGGHKLKGAAQHGCGEAAEVHVLVI
jgi:hypothetical protein